MKKDAWIVYLIVAFTSTTTILTMSDGTLLGFLRGIVSAVVLDFFVIYWERKGETLTDAGQRKWSHAMKWAGVGMLVIIAVAYVLVSFVPVDAVQTVTLFGVVFASTIREAIHWSIVGTIAVWVVLTLAVAMYLREIDPETRKSLEFTKALEERDREEMNAYRIALKVTARKIGNEKAMELFRKNLESLGYTKAQIDQMVEEAKTEVSVANGEIIPVDANMRVMNSDVDANFTKPSTPKN